MFNNLFFNKPQPIAENTCLIHSGKSHTYMCLADNCSQKLLCALCVSEHYQTHSQTVHNIKDYLEDLFRNSRNKNQDDLFAQIKSFLTSRDDIAASIGQLHEDKEHDVLQVFDELKHDINEALDLAYQKYCNSLRSYHSRRANDVHKKINIIQSMFRMQTCIQERSLSTDLSESELLDLVKLFSKYRSQPNSISIDLEDRFKMLSDLVHDHSALTQNMDMTHYNRIRVNILDLIKEQFNIADEYKAPPSTDSANSDFKNSYNGSENDICALLALKDELIATAGRDCKIKLWNLASGECTGELVGHDDTVWDLKSAFDGKYLISSSGDTTIKVWRVNEMKLKKTLKGHNSGVYALEYEEDTKVLASGGQDGSLLLWDMNEGKVRKQLDGHSKAIWVIKKLGGDKILSAGESREIKMWSIKNGALLRTLRGHQGSIFDVSVFADGKKMASCADDGVIILWDCVNGTMIDTLQAHDKGIRSISVNNAGTLMASGGYDRTLRVWDLECMYLLKENTTNDSAIRCIKFVSNSALLYCDTNLKNYKFAKF